MRLIRAFSVMLPLLLSSLAAHAVTVTVDRDVPPDVSVGGASFAADLDLGGAFIVVDFLEHGGEEEQIYSQRLPVPGLTYNAATRTIHLQDGDRDATCAVGKKVLWVTRFRPTSECQITVQPSSQATTFGNPHSAKASFIVEVGIAP